jgi:WhiB family redox-sensing transcriptional regulator
VASRIARPRVTSEQGNGWRREAACRGADPVLFFGPDGEREVQKHIRETLAVAFCEESGCPVVRECREWALASKEAGVWGATTKEQRDKIRRRRQRGRADAEQVV